MFLHGVFHNNPCLPLQPNCYSRAITILGDEHIIIFAKRDIDPWEELTYDYRSGVVMILLDLLNIIVLYNIFFLEYPGELRIIALRVFLFKILFMLSSDSFRVINDFLVIVDSPNAVELLMMLRQRNRGLKSGLRGASCF